MVFREVKVLSQMSHGIHIPSRWFASMWSLTKVKTPSYPQILQMLDVNCLFLSQLESPCCLSLSQWLVLLIKFLDFGSRLTLDRYCCLLIFLPCKCPFDVSIAQIALDTPSPPPQPPPLFFKRALWGTFLPDAGLFTKVPHTIWQLVIPAYRSTIQKGASLPWW